VHFVADGRIAAPKGRIVEIEATFLGQLYDHRGRHRLGIRGDSKRVSARGGIDAPTVVVP
jgi:hypothetical protein